MTVLFVDFQNLLLGVRDENSGKALTPKCKETKAEKIMGTVYVLINFVLAF